MRFLNEKFFFQSSYDLNDSLKIRSAKDLHVFFIFVEIVAFWQH
jgi:hypothetical protein